MSDFTIKTPQTDAELDGKGYALYKSWQETYVGLVDSEYLQRMTLEKCTSISHKNPENTFVANDGDRVVGFVGYGEYRDGSMSDCGEVYALYVLREYHGKKVGFELMNAANVERRMLYKRK